MTRATVALFIFLAILTVLWHMPLVDRSDALAAKITVEKKAQMAQRVLADSFFRTIGVSDQYIPTRDEWEALWELAQLDRANAAVCGKLLKQWLGTADAFMRGEARGGRGFRAATRLNVEYDLLSTSNAAELGDRFAAGLENSQEGNSGEVPDLVIEVKHLACRSDVLAALANKMELQAAAEIAGGARSRR